MSVSRAWSWRHAIVESELQATTRLLLLALSVRMDETGGGCYPSIDQIVSMTGLSKNTVREHIRLAAEGGWLSVCPHGFKGQKWRRLEYAAAWPDRAGADCAPQQGLADSGEKGGSVVDPPLAEGGSMAGSKVGQPLTQDKTSPITTPEEERESAGARGENDAAAQHDAAEAVKRGTGREAFRAAHARWPTHASDSSPEAERAWFALAPDERLAAVAEAGRYVEASKAEGRKLVCSFGVYLREKRWEKLPPKAVEAAEDRRLAAFGPEWAALRLLRLAAGPGPLPRPSAFIAGLIAAGGAAGERERLAHQARYGFPAVTAMDAAALAARGAALPESLGAAVRALGAEMAAARRGSALDGAWLAALQERGWPAPPETPGMEIRYWPAGGVESGFGRVADIAKGAN